MNCLTLNHFIFPETISIGLQVHLPLSSVSSLSIHHRVSRMDSLTMTSTGPAPALHPRWPLSAPDCHPLPRSASTVPSTCASSSALLRLSNRTRKSSVTLFWPEICILLPAFFSLCIFTCWECSHPETVNVHPFHEVFSRVLNVDMIFLEQGPWNIEVCPGAHASGSLVTETRRITSLRPNHNDSLCKERNFYYPFLSLLSTGTIPSRVGLNV